MLNIERGVNRGSGRLLPLSRRHQTLRAQTMLPDSTINPTLTSIMCPAVDPTKFKKEGSAQLLTDSRVMAGSMGSGPKP